MCSGNLRVATPKYPFNKTLKRAFDIVVSSLALAATMPFIIPIVCVIDLHDQGPFFICKGDRAGITGRLC